MLENQRLPCTIFSRVNPGFKRRFFLASGGGAILTLSVDVARRYRFLFGRRAEWLRPKAVGVVLPAGAEPDCWSPHGLDCGRACQNEEVSPRQSQAVPGVPCRAVDERNTVCQWSVVHENEAVWNGGEEC